MRTVVLGLAIAATSVAALPSVTGTYSSLAYHEDSGDLMGAEFRIVYSYEGHFITVQCSGGIPVTKRLKVTESQVSFVLEESTEDDVALCGLGTFSGRVEEDGLWYWKEAAESTAVFVPRQESYWESRTRTVEERNR